MWYTLYYNLLILILYDIKTATIKKKLLTVKSIFFGSHARLIVSLIFYKQQYKINISF